MIVFAIALKGGENPHLCFPGYLIRVLGFQTAGDVITPVPLEKKLNAVWIREGLSSLEMRKELWCSFCDSKREKCTLPLRYFPLSKKG